MIGTTRSVEIAAVAARWVVDEGMEYGAAKRRAARELLRRGARAAELPSNLQVEDAVREHLALFCADTQPDELRTLRQIALIWMDRLAVFRPHLSGAAWRGTATRQSALHIDLYCDDAKGAEIALLNLGVNYDTGELARTRGEPIPVLTIGERSEALGDWVTLHLLVQDLDDQRGALKPDEQGQSWRGDAQALRRLMAPPESPR